METLYGPLISVHIDCILDNGNEKAKQLIRIRVGIIFSCNHMHSKN